MITNVFAGNENSSWWALKVSSVAAGTFVKLVAIMFIGVETVFFALTTKRF